MTEAVVYSHGEGEELAVIDIPLNGGKDRHLFIDGSNFSLKNSNGRWVLASVDDMAQMLIRSIYLIGKDWHGNADRRAEFERQVRAKVEK